MSDIYKQAERDALRWQPGELPTSRTERITLALQKALAFCAEVRAGLCACGRWFPGDEGYVIGDRDPVCERCYAERELAERLVEGMDDDDSPF